jgi:type I restriction enzyme S subunit
LKGLEATVARSNHLERTARNDAEYFQKRFLRSAALIKNWDRRSVAELAHISDGNHFSISESFVDEGVPYYRGQDVTGRFFAETACPVHITVEAYNEKHMVRSHLKRGDVLLSIVGTIGELSILESDAPATCSCKLAILRPKQISAEYLAVFLKSEHGQNQIERMTRGAVQKGLILEDLDQIWVPTISRPLEKRITEIVRKARTTRELTTRKQAEAEELLLSCLGLADWIPPEPLAYIARSQQAVSAGRLDSRFFAPRIQALLDLLSVDTRVVSDVAGTRREKFRPESCETFDYIEIGDVDGAGTAESTRLACIDAPSRATWYVRKGDVVTSTVRPIRRLSAQIGPEQEGFVCSSGFVVIEPRGISSEVLLTYLRLPIICELLDLYASASMYPAITEADIFNLPLPRIPRDDARRIASHVQDARAAKTRALDMLDAAKSAIEMAVESGESHAISWLDQALEVI